MSAPPGYKMLAGASVLLSRNHLCRTCTFSYVLETLRIPVIAILPRLSGYTPSGPVASDINIWIIVLAISIKLKQIIGYLLYIHRHTSTKKVVKAHLVNMYKQLE